MIASSASSRAQIATFSLWGFIALSLVSILVPLTSAGFLDISRSLPSGTLRAINVSLVAGLTGANILCMVTVSLWLYAAHSNLRSLTHSRLEYTPGWAVGWYFVPIANLFKPFFAMQELWKFSQITPQFQKNNELIIEIWWICWIVGNIASYISSEATISDDLTASIFFMMRLFGVTAEIVAAFCLIRIIRDVTLAQQSKAEIDSAFA